MKKYEVVNLSLHVEEHNENKKTIPYILNEDRLRVPYIWHFTNLYLHHVKQCWASLDVDHLELKNTLTVLL